MLRPRPLPIQNYDKVRVLQMNVFVDDQHAHQFQEDLKMFKNLRKMYVNISNNGNCFYGHEPVTTCTQLDKVDYTTSSREDKVTCDECFDCLIKTSKSVKKLSICMPVAPKHIQLIADTISELENLKITKFCSEIEDAYEQWPKMEKLQDIRIPYKKELKEVNVVNHLCEMCPNLKKIRVFESDGLEQEVMDVLAEKLKELKTVQFDNGVSKVLN